MPDIKLLYILKIMYEVIDDPHERTKFDSQTVEASNGPSCRKSKALHIKTDKVDANDMNANMPDYFRSSINRAADKRAKEVLTKMYNEFSDLFQE